MSHNIVVANTLFERNSIFRFRYQVYISELQKTHVEADHSNQMLYDEADRYMVLYYIDCHNQVAGTVRSQRGSEGPFMQEEMDLYGINDFEKFIDHDKIAIVDRLAVDVPFRKTTMAHELMLRTYIDGWAAGTRLCFITCDDHLLAMYIRYGFRIYKEPYLLSSGDKRHRLLLFLCDINHLKKVRSPFLSHLPDHMDDQGTYAALVQRHLDIVLLYQSNYAI